MCDSFESVTQKKGNAFDGVTQNQPTALPLLSNAFRINYPFRLRLLVIYYYFIRIFELVANKFKI